MVLEIFIISRYRLILNFIDFIQCNCDFCSFGIAKECFPMNFNFLVNDYEL